MLPSGCRYREYTTHLPLGHRWDCKVSAQIWQLCWDVTVSAWPHPTSSCAAPMSSQIKTG